MKTFNQFVLECCKDSCNKTEKGTECPVHGNERCPDVKANKTPEEVANKHRIDLSFIEKQLKIGIPIENEHTKDKNLAYKIALQHLEEIPDYYTRLKKMEAEAKKEHKKFKDVKEETKSGDSSLHDWFNKSSGRDPKTGKKVPGWKQLGGKYAGAPCARQPGQTSTPKCGSSKMAANLSDDEEDKAFRRKNRKDPNQPEKTGAAKPTNVATEETILEKKDACYHKVKSRYKVWPSAYASGALVKCRKKGAKNWGNSEVKEEYTRIQSRGTTYSIMLSWRGKIIFTQMFFPQFTRPSKNEVTLEVRKVYPNAIVLNFKPSFRDPTKPLLFTGELDGPRQNSN